MGDKCPKCGSGLNHGGNLEVGKTVRFEHCSICGYQKETGTSSLYDISPEQKQAIEDKIVEDLEDAYYEGYCDSDIMAHIPDDLKEKFRKDIARPKAKEIMKLWEGKNG